MFTRENLTQAVKTIRVLNATAVGTTTLTATAVDMQGFEGVRFLVLFGTITDGTPDLQARQGQLANMSDAATLAGTLASMLDADDNKIGLLDVYKPQERYVDLQIVRGGATGCVVDGVVAELYGARIHPVTQDASVGAAQELHVSPAEGTP
jgi:hypothetical protein